jgi:hypothetical protein
MAKTHPRWKREVLTDFWIIEAADLDVALKLAGVQRWLRRVGSFTTGVPESLEDIWERCRRVEVFVARVSGCPRGAPGYHRR